MKMNLTDKQIQAIEMLATGEWNKSEIAQSVGVDRTTIYNWAKNEMFMAELDKRLTEFKTEAGKQFASRLPEAIARFWKLTGDDVEVRTRAKVLSEWISRSIGSISNSITIDDHRNDELVDVLAAFDKMVADNEEEETNEDNE